MTKVTIQMHPVNGSRNSHGYATVRATMDCSIGNVGRSAGDVLYRSDVYADCYAAARDAEAWAAGESELEVV